jgi:hypothetical protein
MNSDVFDKATNTTYVKTSGVDFTVGVSLVGLLTPRVLSKQGQTLHIIQKSVKYSTIPYLLRAQRPRGFPKGSQKPVMSEFPPISSEADVIWCLCIDLDMKNRLVFLLLHALKGLPHKMDLAFDDIYTVVSLGLKRGRGHFLNFLCIPMILYRNSV